MPLTKEEVQVVRCSIKGWPEGMPGGRWSHGKHILSGSLQNMYCKEDAIEYG